MPNFCGIKFCGSDPNSQKMVPQKCFQLGNCTN